MDPSSGGEQITKSGSGSGALVAPRGYALSGKIMLTAIVILFSVVLFVLFLQLYIRWYALRRSASRSRRRPLVFAAEGPAPPTSSSARGLDPELLKSIPVHVFTSAAVGGEESEVGECAVCLNDFEEGEKIRTLPQCRHRFHVECIDMWLHYHATCPLCRSAIDAVPPPPPLPSADPATITISEEDGEEEEYPPSPAPQPRHLCVTCQRFEEETGASSSSASESVALSIQLSARRVEGLTRGLDEEVGSPGGGFKSPGGSRIMSLRRLLSWDLRLYRGGGSGAEADVECGEAADRSPAPPPPTSH